MITITQHAYLRGKERLSLKRSAFAKLANSAYTNGLRHADMKGYLKKYISGLYLRYENANSILIYGEVIFFFHYNVLITVYQLPAEMKRYVKQGKRKTVSVRQK